VSKYSRVLRYIIGHFRAETSPSNQSLALVLTIQTNKRKYSTKTKRNDKT